jgi:hypothetical protein
MAAYDSVQTGRTHPGACLVAMPLGMLRASLECRLPDYVFEAAETPMLDVTAPQETRSRSQPCHSSLLTRTFLGVADTMQPRQLSRASVLKSMETLSESAVLLGCGSLISRSP